MAYALLLAVPAGYVLADAIPGLLVARWEDLAMLAVISALAPSIFSLLTPYGAHRSPVAFALSATAIVLLGLHPAVWLAGLAAFSAVFTRGSREPVRAVVVVGSYVLSAYAGASVFEVTGGIAGDVVARPLPAVAATLVAMLALALLRSLAALCGPRAGDAHEPPATSYRQLPSYLAMGGFGLGLALIYQAVGPVGLLVFLVPSAMAGQSYWRYMTKAEELRSEHGAREQRLGELQAINQISSHFASMHTLEHTLQLAAVAATKLADFRLAFVLVFDEIQNAYFPGAVSGVDVQLFAEVSGQLCDEFAPATAVGEDPVVITAEQYALYMKALRSLGLDVTCLTLMPITRSEQRIGVLGVGSNGVPTADRMRFLRILAAQTALAIDNASLYLRMKQLAVTDYVTGLHTHRFFQESLDAEIARCMATDRPLALLMLDIDRFKDFNDRHGHPAGDELLRQLGARVKSALRRGDIVCRYGGDEFAVILPDSDRAQAITVAERIRQAVQSTSFLWHSEENGAICTPMTVSIGVSLLTAECQTKQELVSRADQALYSAKEAGRNTLSVSQSADDDTDTTEAAQGSSARGSGKWSDTAMVN